MWAFSCCCEWVESWLWGAGFSCGGLSCGARALEHGLGSCGAWAHLLHSTWDLPGPGVKPGSPALTGRFLTTEPPGKSLRFILSEIRICSLNQTCAALFTELSSLTWLLQPCGSSLAKKGPAGGMGVGMEQHLRARQLSMSTLLLLTISSSKHPLTLGSLELGSRLSVPMCLWRDGAACISLLSKV